MVLKPFFCLILQIEWLYFGFWALIQKELHETHRVKRSPKVMWCRWCDQGGCLWHHVHGQVGLPVVFKQSPNFMRFTQLLLKLTPWAILSKQLELGSRPPWTPPPLRISRLIKYPLLGRGIRLGRERNWLDTTRGAVQFGNNFEERLPAALDKGGLVQTMAKGTARQKKTETSQWKLL